MLVLVLGCATAAGCSDPAGVEPHPPRPGVLQVEGYDGQVLVHRDATVRWSVTPDGDVLVPRQPLLAPDTVEAGRAFHVTVVTIGLSGCWRAVGQDVRMGEGVVELTPMDEHSGAGVCTEILLDLTHRSTVTIDAPGEWNVRVSGRRVRQGDGTWEEPVALEKTVVVL